MSDLKTISKDVEATRARLTQTLGDLSDTVDPQAVSRDIRDTANMFGSDIAQKSMTMLRENPAGGLLAGIGVALLLSGQRRPSAQQPHEPSLQPPIAAMEGFDDRVAAADAKMKANMTGVDQDLPSASHLRQTLEAGLNRLPRSARRRVIAARRSALAAQEAVEHRAKQVARKTGGFVHKQPLAAGAIALGFGVLAGTLLPGTRREDALLGARRDALMSDARNILEQELMKAQANGEALLSGHSSGAPSTSLNS